MQARDVNADGPPSATRQASKLAIDKPGEYEVVVPPADPAKWNAVNLWRLELAPAK